MFCNTNNKPVSFEIGRDEGKIVVGHLLGIAIRKQKRGPMLELAHANVTMASGVEQDFRGKPGDRQITLLTREGWQAACDEITAELPWQARRANLYIAGLNLHKSAGRRLQIGQLQLLITRETDPCNRMQEVHNELFEALAKEWRGGVCCRVIQDGVIHVGNRVEMIDAP